MKSPLRRSSSHEPAADSIRALEGNSCCAQQLG
jgi:hypothetical protein